MLYRNKARRFLCTATEPVVRTTAGQLRGYRSDDVYVFRGIPYATAKRYQMPQPVEPWEGIRDALAYGPGNPEMTMSLESREELDQLMVPGRIWSISETPMNLNVWTRSIDPGARRPVMVWLHGGGFSGGSATHLYSYDGYQMADLYDVVLVTVNHRLNMQGFFNLSAFGGVYAHSGNAGMADLVAALEWVRDNITAFGGDPDNVTIYGQSGGGGKVTTLMQMPAADGLYHRAIIQSGVMRGGPRSDQSAEVAARTVARLGLTAETIEQISALPYDVVCGAIRAVNVELGLRPDGSWAPCPDGDYYPGSPFDVGFRPETAHIPLIVGSCLSEFSPCMPAGRREDYTDTQREALLRDSFGEGADEVRASFQSAYPDVDWRYAVAADMICRPAVLGFLDLRRQQATAPVYNYVFTFESPMDGGRLTGHNGDLHFMFHNASFMDAMCVPGVTERLEDDMAGAWAQFAYAGDPNRAGLVHWAPYTEEEGACMLFGERTTLVHSHDRALLSALTKYPPKGRVF